MTATKKFNILRAMMALFEVMDEEDNSNFAKVTTSPEALAKFIDEKIRYTLDHDECPFVALCEEDVECEECITKWLKQKAEDEE